MAMFLATSSSLLLRTPNNASAFASTSTSTSVRPTLCFRSTPHPRKLNSITTPTSLTLNPNLTSTRVHSTPPANDSDYEHEKTTNNVDEWVEKAESEPEGELTRFTNPDPSKDNDEWGGDDFGNGKVEEVVVDTVETAVVVADDDVIGDLKRALVDTVYGTNLGFGVSVEVRAEVLELVNQLEAKNPTLAPIETPELFGGNWVLV